MDKQILLLNKEVDQYVAQDEEAAKRFYLRYLSKKGVITSLFSDFKNLPSLEKKRIGKQLNDLKKSAEEKVQYLKTYKKKDIVSQQDILDFTLPSLPTTVGSMHPLSIVSYDMIDIFERLGFQVEDGPEIEDEWHNFSALNFPSDHPARDMQDTFFIEENGDMLLRTHTSNVQIRLLNRQSPPVRSIMPGRVYRNETISSRAHAFFHQLEGLYVDRKVSFADLKHTLYYFAGEMYGKGIDVRFRPSYFPFTEPSAEIDIACLICKGKGCPVCKHSGWVEIAGGGMVHPNVLRNCDVDADVYTGFAFGMGIERVAQLKYGVDDIRLYSENDIRFINQFDVL